jgi:hypothetical protein
MGLVLAGGVALVCSSPWLTSDPRASLNGMETDGMCYRFSNRVSGDRFPPMTVERVVCDGLYFGFDGWFRVHSLVAWRTGAFSSSEVLSIRTIRPGNREEERKGWKNSESGLRRSIPAMALMS